MLQIKASQENPYGNIITKFLSLEFPANLTDKCAVFEAVSTVIFGTNSTRYGPMPTPESQVGMRAVIRNAIESTTPIPVLMPWGSKKARNSHTLDVAEVGALKTLKCLNDRIKRFHPSGMQLIMRVEDTSGFYIFNDEGDDTNRASKDYVRKFQKLVRILGLSFIKPTLESELMDPVQYWATAEDIRPLFERYIFESEASPTAPPESLASFRRLLDNGWKGAIAKEQRDFYRQQYQKAFPGITQHAQNLKLARYMTSVLARVMLRGYGNPTAWGSDFIKMTFAPPIPGSPFNANEKTVYLRTLPGGMARTHMPCWRAKGYMRVDANDATIKLVSFSDPLLEQLEEAHVVFTDGNEEVMVQADMLIDEAPGAIGKPMMPGLI